MFLKNLKNSLEAPLPEPFFNNVAGLWPAILLKKRLWRRCFLVNFAKFLKTPFLQNGSGGWFCLINIVIMNHTMIWNKFKNLHWRIFSKKLIASAYAKSPKSLGFNLVLQTFYEMIWEILSSKTVCEIFLIFCRSCLIKNYIIKSKFGSLKITRK